jgi:uncharacterized protein YqfB (UPF0267 family)
LPCKARRERPKLGHAVPDRHLQHREPDESLRFLGFPQPVAAGSRAVAVRDRDEADYRQLEMARAITHADDTRQLSALAIAATRADIVCLQEVDNLAALQAFEYGYLYKMIG